MELSSEDLLVFFQLSDEVHKSQNNLLDPENTFLANIPFLTPEQHEFLQNELKQNSNFENILQKLGFKLDTKRYTEFNIKEEFQEDQIFQEKLPACLILLI